MYKSRKAVAKFLFCLGILEGRVFQLFGRLAEKVELSTARFSLLYLAYDSLKNSVILGELSKSFEMSDIKAQEYKKVLGEVWKTVGVLSKEILESEKIDEKNLRSLAEKLMGIYAVLLVQLKTLRFMSKEISEVYNVDMETLEGILELVIEDEETDTRVLMNIKHLFEEKPEAVVRGTPAVKYTNPDNWYRSGLS
jgi:hypothetical protein